MKLAWDRWCTSDHGSHEYEFWRDAVCDGVVESDLDLSVDGRAGFSGTMYGQSRGDSRLVNFESARHRIRRSSAQARRHGHDRLMLSLQCKGRAVLVQNGAEEAIGPGDLGLLNAGSAFDIDFPEQTGRRLVLLPRSLFGARSPMLARLDRPAAIRSASPLSPMLAETMRLLTDKDTVLEDRTASTLMDTLVEIVSLHFSREGGEALGSRGSSEMCFESIKRHVGLHIADPELTPQSVAAACKVSARTLHRLFARFEETSFERYLIEARLELACEALRGARARTVSEAAYACGFNNLSHFTKRFSARFGVSPVEVLRDGAPPASPR